MHNKARAVCLLVHTDLDTIEVPDSSTPVEEEGKGGVREYDWLQGGPSACVELVGERMWPLALNHRYLLFQLRHIQLEFHLNKGAQCGVWIQE